MGCNNYTPKFYATVERKRKSLPLDKFRLFLDERFTEDSVNAILAAIENGEWDVNFGKAVTKKEVTVLPTKEYSDTGFFIDQQKDRSTLSYYGIEESEGRIAHDKMINRFKTEMIKRLIYDYKTGTSVDATAILPDGSTNVNQIIYDFKVELMKELWNAMGIDLSEDYVDEIQFTKQIVTTLTTFERNQHKSEVMKAYETYVILKNFDSLVNSHFDIISISPAFKNSSVIGKNMYEYTGPSMKRDASIGKESTDADDYTGSILKLLLTDYFPEVVNGQDDPTMKIGLVGFNRVMTDVINWLESSNNKILIDEFNKGEETDWGLIIDRFLSAYESAHGPYISILKSKLKGIRKYIFSSDVKLPYSIMNSFNRHVRDIYNQNYGEYVHERTQEGTFVHNSVSNDYFIDEQVKNISRIIAEKVDLFRSNPKEFDRFCTTHEIEITEDSIKINKRGIGPVEIKLVWVPNTNDKIKSKGQYVWKIPSLYGVKNDSVIELVSDLLDMVIPSNYLDILKSLGAHDLFDVFKHAIILTTSAGSPKFDKYEFHYNTQLDTFFYNYDLQAVGKFYATIFGGETINVVKNKEGNNLPMYSVGSAVRKIKRLVKHVSSNRNQAFTKNRFREKPDILGKVITRSQAKVGDQIKSSQDNTISEIATEEVIHDFHEQLLSTGVIWIQPICYSDKSTHTIFEVDTTKDTIEGAKVQDILKKIAAGESGYANMIIKDVYNRRKYKTKSLLIDMLNRYGKVFKYTMGIDFAPFVNSTHGMSAAEIAAEEQRLLDAWDDLRKTLQQLGSVKELRKHFKKYNENHKDATIDLIENYDFGTGVDGKLDINWMLMDDVDTYLRDSSLTTFKNNLERAVRITAEDYLDQGWTAFIDEHKSLKSFKTDANSIWYDHTNGALIPFIVYDKDGKPIKRTSTKAYKAKLSDPTCKVVLNPLLSSHFFGKLLYAGDLKDMLLGNTHAYNSKASFKGDPNNPADVAAFKQSVRAAKIIEETKRALYCGATTTTYLQGLTYGVPRKANVACVSDIAGSVFNPQGVQDSIDVHDGSSWVSPYWALQTNESLADASVGWNKKTIYGHIDPETGVFTEIKHAEFALSNQYRKMSPDNDYFSAERMFEKMHSVKIPAFKFDSIDLTKFYSLVTRESSKHKPGILTHSEPVFYFDVKKAKYFQIISISQDKNVVTRRLQEVNERGVKIGEEFDDEPRTIENIYHLDQLFGGAFCKERNSEGYLVDSDANNYIVNNIICENNLKDYMIHFVCNKSAIKVGQKNLNSSDIFSDINKDELQTFQISTEFGGVIMDADHELEDSEVREMGQLVSALMQEGHNAALAKEIYQEIGEVVMANVAPYVSALGNPDQTELFNKLGEALLHAFSTQEKDVIGLAQAFISKFEQGNQKYQIPFSSATIAPAFMSAVSSVLTQKGIKRKFPGVGAVQVPGRGVMMNYNFGGITYDYEGAVKYAAKRGVSVDVASSNPFIDINYGPFKYILEQFPQISEIGTIEEYATYLNSIRTPEQIIDLLNEVASPIEGAEPFIGSELDLNSFKAWKEAGGVSTINPFIESIQPEDIDFEDTIIVEGELIKINDLKTRDYYRNIYKKPILRHNFKPRDLLPPIPKIVVNGKTYSIYDLDSVRICNYITEILNEKDPNKQLLLKMQYTDALNGTVNLINMDTETLRMTRGKWRRQVRSDFKELSEIQKSGSGVFKGQIAFGEELEVVIDEIIANPGQIVMGKAYARQLGISDFDSLADIKEQGPKFFENKLRSELTLPTTKLKYDAVAYMDDGTKVLIVIGDGINSAEKLGNTTLDTKFKNINGTIYRNATDEVCEAEGIECRKYVENGKEYSVLVLENINLLDSINSSRIITTVRYNYNESNYLQFLSYEHDIELTEKGLSKPLDVIYKEYNELGNFSGFVEATHDSLIGSSLIYELRRDEAAKTEKKIINLAKRRYDSFTKSLRFIGTRIPAQSMQSFMPLEIVGFTNSKLNDVYVPHMLTWVAGSDYDIDKLYMMGYYIEDTGKLATYSTLSVDYNIDEVLKLPEPKQRKFEEDSTSDVQVSFETLYDFANNDSLIGIDQILRQDVTKISFEEPTVNKKQFERWKRKFIRVLNYHERSKLNSNARTNALKNRIVNQIETLMLDVYNVINMMDPISMDSAKEAAANTSLGNREKLMHYDIPTSMMIMQYQNMLGKNVIGSGASGLKAYFGELTYFNDIVGEIEKLIESGADHQLVFNELKQIIFDGKFGKKDARILANVPLDRLISLVKSRGYSKLVLTDTSININMQQSLKEYIKDGVLDLDTLLEDVQERSWAVNASGSISEILSAATDNAKELILAKINATMEFADIYVYLVSTGKSIAEIAKFMTSDAFNIVSRFTKSNLFVPTEGFHNNLDRVINFVLDKEPLSHVGSTYQFHKLLRTFAGRYARENDLPADLRNRITNRDSMDGCYELLRISEDARDEFVEELRKKCEEAKKAPVVINHEEYDDEEIIVAKRTTYDEALAMYNYVTLYLNPKNEILSDSEFNDVELKLTELKDIILPGVQEQKMAAGFFSINKGLKTKDFDEYAWVERQNKIVNEYLQSKKADSDPDFEKFDFIEFVLDREETKDESGKTYRQRQIEQMDKYKSAFNVLDCITKVDHFWNMLKLVGYNRQLIEKAGVYRIERKIANEILSVKDGNGKQKLVTKSFSISGWKELANYTRDVITYNWFIRHPDLKILVQPEWTYYSPDSIDRTPIENKRTVDESGKDTSEVISIDLTTQEGIATFKHLVENYIVPMLKSDPEFKSNMFIQYLTRTGKAESLSQEYIRKLAFPFQITKIEKGSSMEKLYESIVKSFNKDMYKNIGKKYGFGNWTLGDLFFVYNLIVNKEGFGKGAMTKIFEDSINFGKELKTAESYYDYIKRLDYHGDIELEYDLTDLRIRLANTADAYKVGVELEQTEKGYFVYSKNFGIRHLPLAGINKSDFTFNMQSSKRPENISALPSISYADYDRRFEPKLDNDEVVETIVETMVKQIENKGNIPIKLVSSAEILLLESQGILKFKNRDALNRAQNAHSFIYNGTIYINKDKSLLESPIHELFHVICAGMKFSANPEIRKLYYKLLNDVARMSDSTLEYYTDIEEKYSDKHGSDKKEEVLVRMLTEKFKNEFSVNWTKFETGGPLFTYEIKKAIIETMNVTFGTTISDSIKEDDLGNYTLEQALVIFKSNMFELDGNWIATTSLKHNQIVATLKDRLVKRGDLKIGENC